MYLKDKNCEPVFNQMIKVNDTEVRLGKQENFPSFGWDNEYGQLDCK